MKEKIEKLVSKHTIKMFKAQTLEEMAQCENDFTKKLLTAINYTRCSLQLKDKESISFEGWKINNLKHLNMYGGQYLHITKGWVSVKTLAEIYRGEQSL